MRTQGFEGESGRRKVRTTIVDRRAKAAEDRVGRDFNPAGPNVTWCGDITYLRTGEGWLYLATVIDLFSRRVIGWSLAEHMRTTLVADALETAVATRGGRVDAGVLFHSDRGCQYTSAEFGELCDRLGIVQSMGATGVCLLSGYSSRECSARALISWEGACIARVVSVTDVSHEEGFAAAA
jgi:transposase InsO family protein